MICSMKQREPLMSLNARLNDHESDELPSAHHRSVLTSSLPQHTHLADLIRI